MVIAMNNGDNRKEGFGEGYPQKEQLGRTRPPRPEIFDIEKSDEEFSSDAEQPKAPPADSVSGSVEENEFYNLPRKNAFEIRENQRPQAENQPAKPSVPPIRPKRSVYKPDSFKELPPDIASKHQNGSERINEPTIAIPKRALNDADGVKIYGGGTKNEANSSLPQPTMMPRSSKPFKLKIEDEDYNAIPDFDNRANRSHPTPPPLAAPSVPKRGKAAAKGDLKDFDYVPPQPGGGVSPRPVNKTMRSLGRLANGILYTVGVLVVSILLSVFILQSMSDVLGMFKTEKEMSVNIPQGANTQTVATILKQNGIIAQPLTFRLYTKYRYDEDETYLTGNFTLNSAMSYDEIMQAIRVRKSEKQVVTIPIIEGMSAREIAKKLEENKVCKADDFIDVLQTTDFGYEFEKLIPTGGNRYIKLEGYLFPDTYQFYINEPPKSVANKFLKNFNTKITPDLIERIDKMGFTLDQAITLASIIQKEGRTLDDMYKVSAVFNNRLNSKGKFPKLQSDVTINYVNDNITPYVTNTADQQAYASVYNTYKCDGLPVGPVGNPGVSAIKTAIYPDEEFYYYFVTDAKMKYYFAATLAQHEANIAKAKEAGGEVGGVTTHEE